MKSATIEFTVTMSEFKRKVRATQYAASTDTQPWMLDHLKVIVEAKQVMLLATDRYKMIATRQDVTPDTPYTPGVVSLTPKALKYLGMMAVNSDDKITIRANDTGYLELETIGETLTLQQATEDYPAVEGLLYERLDKEPTVEQFVFSPHTLEAITKSAKTAHGNTGLVFQGTGDLSRPVLVYAAGATDWVAMAMPLRITNISEAVDEARNAFVSLLAEAGMESKKEK